MKGWLLNWLRMESQPQPGCPAKFNASNYDRRSSGQYKHSQDKSISNIYIVCNMITFQCIAARLWDGLTVFIWILMIWSLVMSIPYRPLGLDFDWPTCLVNISICLPLSGRSSGGDHSDLHVSLRLLRFPGLCCVAPLSSLARVADQLGYWAAVFHSRGSG